MNFSQKRTCNECKALECYPDYGKFCMLRYQIQAKKGKSYEYQPLEPCYKPLTYQDYLIAVDIIYYIH